MIGARSLLELARPGPTGTAAASDPDEGLRIVGRSKLRLVGGRIWRYPRRDDLLRPLVPALSAAQAAGRLAEVVATLSKPTVAYLLAPDLSRMALIGCFEGPEPFVIQIELNSATAGISCSYTVLSGESELLALELEELASRIPEALRSAVELTRTEDDKVLVIGGSDNEARVPGWRAELEALCEARGFEPVVLENVATRPRDVRDTARKHFSGRAAYVLAAYCGSSENAEMIFKHGCGRSFLIDERDPAEQLDMLRIHLDELADELPEPVAGQPQFSLQAGEVYYFKKIAPGGGGKGDVMVRKEKPCGHNKWKSMPNAPQAEMGITSLVGEAPVKLDHCQSCQGGGFWRARF